MVTNAIRFSALAFKFEGRDFTVTLRHIQMLTFRARVAASPTYTLTGAKLAKPALQRGKGKGKSVDTFLTLAPGSNPQVKKVVSFLAT